MLGKTFFLMGMVKNFLDQHENGGVVYFESESAITKQMVIDRGIDANRMVIALSQLYKSLDIKHSKY